MDLTEREINNISFEIISVLDGIPIGQAHYILRNTKALLNDCHIVDIDNPRFKVKFEELEGHGSSSVWFIGLPDQ